MKRIFSPVTVAMALIVAASYLVFAAVIPAQINYQGRLTDAQGNSVNGTVQMAVKLYNAPTGVTNALLYSETIGPVAVTNGVYRFAFGGTNGTNGIAAALTATSHYLALVVNGVEQTNRTQLLAVPFALKAQESADAQALALQVAALTRRLDDAGIPSGTTGMALIPAGSFQMGNALSAAGDGSTNELPVHTVSLSAFYIDKSLVTKAQWDAVQAWGVTNGYTDLPVGAGEATNHPVQNVTWYAIVKWCNARSKKEGLTECYTVSGSVYKTGSIAPACNFSANGYRLPTEAEWENGARGGLSGKRFPWGDTINRSQANYYVYSSGATNYYSYDQGTPTGYDPTWMAAGSFPYRSPVGSYAANGYGLFDMAGNVSEWCWDWYGSYGSGSLSDPTGPASGSYRVHRGGSSGDYASYCRVAYRNGDAPAFGLSFVGFRCARSSVP